MTGSHEVTGSIPVGSTTSRTASASPAIHLFEDENPLPLQALLRLRPACELRSGALSLRERCERSGAPLQLRVRAELQALVRGVLGDDRDALESERWLSLNARARFAATEIQELLARAQREDFALVQGDVLVARAGARTFEELDGVAHESVTSALWNAPWELVHEIPAQIAADFASIQADPHFRFRSVSVLPTPGASYREHFEDPFASGEARIDPGVHLLDAERIHIARGARLQPGCVLNAEGGPILIGAGASIGANTTILGPAVIGAAARVHPNSKLREGCVIGALCRVGGEIEESILFEASNKQHDGFLGHAVVASWVNLGANTTVSDLKNNYGNVRVDFGEGAFDSGERFVGPTIADHSKTAIGTLLGTGSVVDVGCNVLGIGFPPRYLKPYSWGGAQGVVATELEKAIATMRTVVGRREAELSPELEALLRAIHASC